MHEHEYADDDIEDEEPISAYCVRCKENIEMEEPEAVWTRRGTPGTRGECPECGGTVFRMGKTYLHDGLNAPRAVEMSTAGSGMPKLPPTTVYVAYTPGDEEVAEQLAADLQKSGVATWQHDAEDRANWAGGVHPALQACQRLVLILTPAALEDEDLRAAWTYFREQRKPIVIAQWGAGLTPPNDIRRSPRYDLAADYKGGLRALLDTLSR